MDWWLYWDYKVHLLGIYYPPTHKQKRDQQKKRRNKQIKWAKWWRWINKTIEEFNF